MPQRPLYSPEPSPPHPHPTNSLKSRGAPWLSDRRRRSLGGDGGGGRKRCLVSGEGDFSFTCHVALQMVTLLGSSGSRFLNSPPSHLGMGVEADGGGWHLWGGGAGSGRRKRGRQTRRLDGGFHSGASPLFLSFSSGRQRRRRRLRRRRQRQQGQATPLSKWRRLAQPVSVTRRAEPPGWAGGARGGAVEGSGGGRGSGLAGSWPPPARPPRTRCVPAGPARAFSGSRAVALTVLPLSVPVEVLLRFGAHTFASVPALWSRLSGPVNVLARKS